MMINVNISYLICYSNFYIPPGFRWIQYIQSLPRRNTSKCSYRINNDLSGSEITTTTTFVKIYQCHKEAQEFGRSPEIREIEDQKSQFRHVIMEE